MSDPAPNQLFHSVLLDYMHWVGMCRPDARQNTFPTGKLAGSLHVNNLMEQTMHHKRKKNSSAGDGNDDLPPTTRRRINDLVSATDSSIWRAQLPPAQAAADAKFLAPFWTSVLKDWQADAKCEPVPISLSTHEDRMLVYPPAQSKSLSGRPVCCLGSQCAARLYPGNQGPLPIYVTMSDQAKIDAGQHVDFDPKACCLLCMRRDVHSAVLAWGAMVPNPQVQIRREACAQPPFINLVDCVGGYKSEAMCTNNQQAVFGAVSIVGASGALAVKYDVKSQSFYFDQSRIKHPLSSRDFRPGATNLKSCFVPFALHCAELDASPAVTAMMRAATIHSAVRKLSSPSPGVVASCSFYIQSHAACANTTLSVQQVYAQKLNPAEACHATEGHYPLLRHTHLAKLAWHSQQFTENKDVVAKLMRKGGPAPSSVRYVCGLLIRCMQCPDGRGIVREMIISNLLGCYRHSRVCADPATHFALMRMTDKQLVAHAQSVKTTRQLHHMVSEYVCAATAENHAVHYSVRHVAAIHATGVACGSLRVYGKATVPPAATLFSAFMTLARALTVNNAAPSTLLLSDEEKKQCSLACGYTLNVPLLKTVAGISSSDIGKFLKCYDRGSSSSLKSMRSTLKGASAKALAFLRLYMWHVLKKSRVACVVLQQNVKQSQMRAIEYHDRVMVQTLQCCIACCRPRSIVHGFAVPKAKAGVSKNILTGETMCNACQQPDMLVHVNLLGRMLWLRPNFPNDKSQVCITLCCSCAKPAVVKTKGCYPVCSDCEKTYNTLAATPTPCPCGTQPATGANWVACKRKDGSLRMVFLCTRHRDAVPDSVVDLDALITKIKAM